jgi:hypothetical protein
MPFVAGKRLVLAMTGKHVLSMLLGGHGEKELAPLTGWRKHVFTLPKLEYPVMAPTERSSAELMLSRHFAGVMEDLLTVAP